MHEISLCKSILRVIEEQSFEQNFQKVEVVVLEVGALAGAEISALTFAFDVVMKGSIVSDARLDIISIAGQAWCLQCEKNIEIKQRYDACPHCNGHQLKVNGGEELRIKELEVG